jgi:chromosome segregation ATPase
MQPLPGLLQGITMKQATDQDIRELKTAIDAIGKGTEANTKAIADLTASVSGLREEMRVGFANVETRFTDLKGQINNVETKLEGQIAVCNTKLAGLESTAQKLPDLAEKVGELKNWKQLAIVIFTASVSGAIAWFLRSGKL